MSFDVVFADSRFFKSIVETLAPMIGVCELRFKRTGFGICAMNSSNVVMASLFIKSAATVKYEVVMPAAAAAATAADDDAEMEITIDLGSLNKVIKSAVSDAPLRLWYNTKTRQKMNIEFGATGRVHWFEMFLVAKDDAASDERYPLNQPLVSEASARLAMSDARALFTVMLNSTEPNAAVCLEFAKRDASAAAVDDNDGGVFRVSSEEHGPSGRCRTTRTTAGPQLIQRSAPPFSADFSIPRLHQLTDAMTLAPHVTQFDKTPVMTLHMCRDRPVSVVYEFKNDGGNLTLHLAPKFDL